MDQQPITVVSNGNIAGSHISNVGNVAVNYITNVTQAERERGKGLTLESCVAFDALLNAKERYPPPRCHVDTRIAVQGVVTNWICRKGMWANKGIMWMSGAPGVGKSAIVQTVCETLGGDDGSKSWLTKFGFSDRDVDACYFFGRGMGDREKASFFSATIAYQLARSRMSFNDSINKKIANNASILAAAFPAQFEQLVLKSVKALWWFQHPATIVIDALDECDNVEDQVKLLSLILEAVTSTRTRFLIASRPEQHIHAFFQRMDVSHHTYHIRLDEESFNTSRDIEVFLRTEFARIRREKPHLCLPLPNGEDWPGNIVIIRIRDDSDSQFIFPTLFIGFIDTPFYSPVQQLQLLLATPPPRAFSKLDALYERILSRCPPDLREESSELQAYQKLVLDILSVIVAWPEPTSAAAIAGVLQKEVDVVQNIVLGPMRSLFKLDPSKPNSPVILCHKSLRDYLLDIERSRNFFIPSADSDALFMSILSRRPPSDHPYSPQHLRRALAVMTLCSGGLDVPRIAQVVDVEPDLVQNVVLGPANALFDLGADGNVQLLTPSLKPFLQDRARSGEFCVQDEDPDVIFIRILSTPPPSGSYSRDDLLDVLTAVTVARDRPITKQEIKDTLLGVDVNIVECVIRGPARPLFDAGLEGAIQFASSLLPPFLQDSSRSGEFFIQGKGDPDAIFIRLLSRKPSPEPSQSYSREVLQSVLRVVVALVSQRTVPQIASFLGVAPSLVKGIIFGPSKALFKLDYNNRIGFSTPNFKPFLLDPNRAGEFFVPTDKLDPFFIQTLSLQPPSDPLKSYSPEVLAGVLRVVVALEERVKVSDIASLLDIAPSVVKRVVLGPARALFAENSGGYVGFSTPSFDRFLLDASCAGEFFVSTSDLDALFNQVLHPKPPSQLSSYSQEVLAGVLMVVLALGGQRNASQIASALDIAPNLVKDAIFGPAAIFFKQDNGDRVAFLPLSFKAFLRDANRAGEFFVPTHKINALFAHTLSRTPPPDPSQSSRYRDTLMGVLTVLVVWGDWLTVPQIASALDVDTAVVEGVILGPARLLFHVWHDGDVMISMELKSFLQDVQRAGEFYIPSRYLTQNHDAMYAKIEQIRFIK